ncbi:MAG: 30S ribosomal protein S14 [Gammaproteobacteria bacterium]|nr:30S ribosomal protein S14 [Gammaproteobacteria bacterium]
MAKVSMINRERRRRKEVKRQAVKREQLKKIIADPNSGDEAKREAVTKLNKLPRNGSPIRLRNRCALTGRPHGYYRKFGLGRNKLREAAMRGDVPGLVKSSW